MAGFLWGVLVKFKSFEAQSLPGLAEVSGGTNQRRGFWNWRVLFDFFLGHSMTSY